MHLYFIEENAFTIGVVTKNDIEQGRFILDPNDTEETAKAEKLGVNMKYACYA